MTSPIKLSINYFDRIRFDIEFVRDNDGRHTLHGLFPHFLNRPGDPHLSLFAKFKHRRFEPHFTARPFPSNVFRRTLARISADRLAKFDAEAEREFLPHYAAALEATDLESVEAAGWTVPASNPAALRRWLEPGCWPGRELRVERRTLETFVRHLLIHSVNPTAWNTLTTSVRLLVIRLAAVDEDVEVRPLMHFADGFWIRSPQGEIIQVRPAGWYWHPFDIKPEAVARRIVPAAMAERVWNDVDRYLKRFPRRNPEAHQEEAIPAFISQVGSHFLPEILALAASIAIEQATGPDPKKWSKVQPRP